MSSEVVICLDCRSLQLFLFVQWMVSCFWFKFEQCQFLSFVVLMFTNDCSFRRTNELKVDVDIPVETKVKFERFWKKHRDRDTPLQGA